ncbi:MAG: hypothetical protein ACR2QO_16345 [Acidimicrobiales bacterium]
MRTTTSQTGPAPVGPRHNLRVLLVLIAAVALFISSCASSDSDSTDAGSDSADNAEEASGDTEEAGETSEEAGADDSDDAESTEDATEETTTTVAVEDPEVDPLDAAEVMVLDQGMEPRAELRLQIEPGQSEIMVVTQEQEISQTIGGQSGPDIGAIGMVIEQQLTSSDAGADLLTFTSLVTSATVAEDTNPLIAAELQTALDGMVGVTTRSVVDTRGRVLKTELDGLQSIDPVIADTMEQLTTNSQFAHPLPEEPVGAGAKWQVTQVLDLNGLEVEQVTSYEILAMEGSVVELALASEQFVAEGSELVADGTTATVLLWEGITSGSITYDLTSMVPTSTAQLFANQELEFGPGAEKTVLEQSIQTTLTVSQG